MLIPLKWMDEYLKTGLSLEEADRVLTMLGLEVEGVEKSGDDHVMDVNVTPNRPDCLSVLGVARELAGATGETIRLPEFSVPDGPPSDFKIEIQDSALCSRYMGRIIRGVRVGESPPWMQKRLEQCGVRSINNIVDITNYALMEFGHPLHAFDLETLKGATIRVATAGPDRSITTLDGIERDLPEDALLIWDGERPVAIAGVMGGAETEVSGSTVDILIESAYFKPESVRQTARTLGLKSEASFRFERGTDIIGLETALDRAASLVLELAGGSPEAKMDAYPVPFTPKEIIVRHEKVNRLLGTSLKPEKMLELLASLGLDTRAGSESFTVTAPSFRPDLERDADVIEEIARLYGYGNIPTELPVAGIEAARENPWLPFVRAVRNSMLKSGFSEAISYSFMSEADLDLLGIPEGDARRSCVTIRNPLRQEEALMRTTMVPALIKMFTFNFFRGNRAIRLFETGKVFKKKTDELLPKERTMLGGVYSVSKARSFWKDDAAGFYVVKGALDSLLDSLRVEGVELARSKEPWLHPGKSADIVVAGNVIGSMGVLSPEIIERLDLKSNPEAVVFELDLDALSRASRRRVVYRPTPRHPFIERDVALVLEESIPAMRVLDLIGAYPSGLIEESWVFDEYRGKGIPDGRKSMTFGIRYRSAERTLTDDEAEAVHQGLVAHLKEQTGAETRA